MLSSLAFTIWFFLVEPIWQHSCSVYHTSLCTDPVYMQCFCISLLCSPDRSHLVAPSHNPELASPQSHPGALQQANPNIWDTHDTYAFRLVHSRGMETAFSNPLRTDMQRSQQLSPGLLYTKGTEWNYRITQERCSSRILENTEKLPIILKSM